MLYSGSDPESYITEYTLVYEDKMDVFVASCPSNLACSAMHPQKCEAVPRRARI